jgi:hypothetical protein
MSGWENSLRAVDVKVKQSSGYPPASSSFSSDSSANSGIRFPPLGDRIKALLVWPEVPRSFWTILMPCSKETSAVPPLGLLTIAALCPKKWLIRFVDEQVEKLLDEDIRAADLVMVSGMQVQKDSIKEILLRAHRLGKRTIIGGPYVSSEPESLLPFADHLVIGEADAVFERIAADLEHGTAQRVYSIADKPDVNCAPVPRFDLLKMDHYATMAVQFSRGCPFQCEFCDIISLYGRTPRTKQPAQLLVELERLFELGWRKPVFIVDDNFIGNQKCISLLQTDTPPVAETAKTGSIHDQSWIVSKRNGDDTGLMRFRPSVPSAW